MMITVRFPNGHAVQYNEARLIVRGETGYHIYEGAKEKNLFAWVPYSSGAIVEWNTPCRVYNPLTDNVNEKVMAELVAIKKELRAIRAIKRK